MSLNEKMTSDPGDSQTQGMLKALAGLKNSGQADVRDWARRFEQRLKGQPSSYEPSMAKRVLIIEDDREMCGFLSDCLRDGCYQPTVAFDGRSGLEMARMLKPDLVVVDLLLPEMHGFDVCDAIRKDSGLCAAKILVSTAKHFEVDRRAALRMGADAFLSKPYAVNDFLGHVRRLIGEPA
jgi:two-component system phosphate regulon response regulator PhoB